MFDAAYIAARCLSESTAHDDMQLCFIDGLGHSHKLQFKPNMGTTQALCIGHLRDLIKEAHNGQ